jgi:hypothetical protein
MFNLEKIKRSSKNIARRAGKYWSLIAVALFLMAFFVAGSVFYQYVFPLFTDNFEISASPVKINQVVYEQIKSQLKSSQQNLQNVLNSDYHDPFQ